jgi:hypothetical protein
MNEYAFLAVREIDPTLSPETDGLTYPLPAERINDVVFEPLDGANPQRLVSRSLSVHDTTGGTLKRLARLHDVKIDVIITDARVAVACSKYEKGGGWIGSPGAMIMLNAASKARAAFRRRGKMLVGHVRYESLAAVGASPKMGFLDKEALRLLVTTESGRGRALDITLPSNVDSVALARAITHRAAHHRLTTDGTLGAEQRAELEQLANAASLHGEKGEFAFYRFPTPSPVGSANRIGGTVAA